MEWLLEADRALAEGRLDEAERRYRQAAGSDVRNAIAVVGLARIALAREDVPAAWQLIDRALAIDPNNAAARSHAALLATADPVDPVDPVDPNAPGDAGVAADRISSGPMPGSDDQHPRGLVSRLFERR